ncbi:MAG: peptide deformylase [Pseudohongiellaceae bacterium]|jgi:peptide deformylase
MSLLTILEYPDLRLRKRASPVTEVTDALRKTIDDMFETMYAAPGIGLAATQVNIHKRLLVLDVSENKDTPLVFINPEIDVLDPEPLGYEEGCLSVPGYYDLVSRPRKIRVKALNRNGQAFEMEAEGLLAVCLQHEADHLEGKLFVDYLSILKRQRIKAKLQKDRKRDERGDGKPAKDEHDAL